MTATRISRRRFIAAGAGLMALSAAPARASPLAGKTIRIVYPFAAGNTGDAVARILADQLQRSLGAVVFVENRAGAAGRTGTQSVIRSEPDGTTLLLAPLPVISIYPHSYDKLGYDPFTELQPISQVVLFDIAFVSGPKPGFDSLKSLIAWVRANPSAASYGSSGAGGISHLFAVLFAQHNKLDMKHVGYRGSAPAVNDVIAGHIPFASVASGDCIELHKAGTVRMLGVSGPKRLAVLPDVPTFTEGGIPIDGTAWYSLYAPTGTPAPVVTALHRGVADAMQVAAARERLQALGTTPVGSSPEELARIQVEASKYWEPAVRASGFRPDH
jgi:tripartite-type tricarboxylate transporter receptor subunit TctC